MDLLAAGSPARPRVGSWDPPTQGCLSPFRSMHAVTLATQSPKTQQPDSQQLLAALPTLYSSLTFCWPPVIAMAFMKTVVILLVALLAVPSMAQFGELLSKGFSCAYSLMPAQTCGFCQL